MIDWMEMAGSLKLQDVGTTDWLRITAPLRGLEQDFARGAAALSDDTPLALVFDPAPEGEGR